MPRIAIIDFETTGMSPVNGDRPTEVALVMMEGDTVVDSFQSLMNPGIRIPSFISHLTGITDAMVAQAPAVEDAMERAARFVGNTPLVAHNASFDRKFWQAELHRLRMPAEQPFACTVLLSRRLYPDAPSHKLSLLASHLNLPRTGRAHRALSDAMVTAELWSRIRTDLRERHGMSDIGHAQLCELQNRAKSEAVRWLRQHERSKPPSLRQASPPQPAATHQLQRLLSETMPFGKYKGRVIADLPGHYLNWFAREGFPKGDLGQLLALMHTIDHNGLQPLLWPLRGPSPANAPAQTDGN